MQVSALGMTQPKKGGEGGESNRREQEIIWKGIERLEKQLRQLTQNILDAEPVDISLIKKCKMANVPCVHVGNIQKALQI